MGRKITATEIFDSVEVDLWGNEYKLRDLTRSTSSKLEEAQARAAALDPDDNDSDAAAEALIDVIDVMIAPVGKTPAAGEMLKARWEADELGVDWLVAFAETLRDEAQARRRPTSVTPTGA